MPSLFSQCKKKELLFSLHIKDNVIISYELTVGNKGIAKNLNKDPNKYLVTDATQLGLALSAAISSYPASKFSKLKVNYHIDTENYKCEETIETEDITPRKLDDFFRDIDVKIGNCLGKMPAYLQILTPPTEQPERSSMYCC